MARTATALATATALLALTSCSTDAAAPEPLPTTSQTPAPTASPSATASFPFAPPTLPAAATGTTPASAEAFVRYWIRVLNYSGPAGESSQLRKVSQPSCVDCDAIADFIDDVRANGGSISGKGWTVIRLDTVLHGQGRQAIVKTDVRVQPQQVVMRAGKPVRRFPGGDRTKTFKLRRDASGWRLYELKQSLR